MFDFQIFIFGLVVSLILGGGLVLTVLEFRDIDKNPGRYYPKRFPKNSTWDDPKSASVTRRAKQDFTLGKKTITRDSSLS